MIPFYRFVEVTVYSILNLMPFLLLALYLFRKSLRFPRPVTTAMLVAMGIVQIGLGYLTAFSFVTSEVMSLASTVIYAGFLFLVIKDRIGRIAFVLLVLANIGNLVSICAKCMEGMLFGDLALENYRWSMILCMLVMHALITIPVSLYASRYFTTRLPIHNKYWAYLWLIPTTFYVIWYYHLYFAGYSSLEIAMDPMHAMFLLIINAGAFVVYHCSILLLLAQDENAKLTHNNYLLNLQNIQYENLQQRIDEARRAKHDVRHHARLTLEYLRSGKLNELEAYLEQYSSSLPDAVPIVYCENYEANSIFNYFEQQAQQNGITLDVLISLPQDIALRETTITLVLGNLLENATDACKEITSGEKKISVRGKASNGFVYFEISNNYAGKLTKTKYGSFVTTKKNGKGLGLQSVAHLVKLHEGVFEIEDKDNVFRASVMLKELPRI